MLARIEMERSAPLEGQFALQEISLQRHLLIEIEGVQVQHLVGLEIRLGGAEHLRHGIDGVNLLLKQRELGGGHEIHLVEQDSVGEGDLLLRLRGIVEMQ